MTGHRWHSFQAAPRRPLPRRFAAMEYFDESYSVYVWVDVPVPRSEFECNSFLAASCLTTSYDLCSLQMQPQDAEQGKDKKGKENKGKRCTDKGKDKKGKSTDKGQEHGQGQDKKGKSMDKGKDKKGKNMPSPWSWSPWSGSRGSENNKKSTGTGNRSTGSEKDKKSTGSDKGYMPSCRPGSTSMGAGKGHGQRQEELQERHSHENRTHANGQWQGDASCGTRERTVTHTTV